MPVILLAEDYERWLTGTYDEVIKLQSPFPSQLMALMPNLHPERFTSLHVRS